MHENVIIALVFLINTLLLTAYFFKPGRQKGKLLLFVFVSLLLFQFRTVNIKNTYSFTPSEIDMQIQRMNYYPPSQSRLGYIMEYKREIKIVEKYIENFIEIVDFNSYYPDYFSFLSLPMFFIGLYIFITNNFLRKGERKGNILLYCLTSTVFVLGFLGVHGEYGPFLVFPFIILFICIGSCWLLDKTKLYEFKD